MVKFPEDIVPLREYLQPVMEPIVIAGPCSAESEEQVLSTARELAEIPQVAAFRCGIWKPRTRPGDFEGLGQKALTWLDRVKAETRLPVCVEVAIPAHIELCLKHGVDVIWVGSRTVVNPFSVHELAEALKGVDIPVMVKNPVNPELQLWIGALERLHQHGIRRLVAIHRGFSAYGSRLYRNVPIWEIPIELRRLFPNLPVLVDPSHISGNRDLVPSVSQTALHFAFDGLMIEAHTRPEDARTDRDQQITPSDLVNFLDQLTIPSHANGEDQVLKHLRSEIDQVDDQLLVLIARRMEIASRMGRHKRQVGIDYLQIDRWKQVVEDRLKKAGELGLNREFLLNLLRTIHEEALRIQEESH
jgi:chorismate mutase